MEVNGSLQRTTIDFGGVIFGIGVFNSRVVHGIVLIIVIAGFIFIQSIGKEPPAQAQMARQIAVYGNLSGKAVVIVHSLVFGAGSKGV